VIMLISSSDYVNI